MSKKELEREIARLRGELEIIRDTVTDHGEDSVPVAWLVDRCDAALAGVNDEEEEGV